MLEDFFLTSLTGLLNSLNYNPSLLVAFSGGVDSVVLLDLLYNYNKSHNFPFTLLAAHLHHGLRGDLADSDLDFCEQFCISRNIKFFKKRENIEDLATTRKLGIEEAGRYARYKWFYDLSHTTPLIVLTGHHADDQSETILMNLRRGAHRRGLCGMKELTTLHFPPQGKLLVFRPLLKSSKSSLISYAQERNLMWREDHTNTSLAFKRNRIRHKIIPILETILPGFTKRLNARAAELAIEEEVFEQRGRELLSKYLQSEPSGFLLNLHSEIFSNYEILSYAFRHLLEDIFGFKLPYGAILTHLIFLAESSKVGEALCLPGNIYVRREHDGLFFFNPDYYDKADFSKTILPDPPFDILLDTLQIKSYWQQGGFKPQPRQDNLSYIEYFNPSAIRWPLSIRSLQPGDRMKPLGSPGSKKVQDIITDLKIPKRKRSDLRIIEDYAGIIWLWPYRISHRVRVTNTSGKLLQLTILPTK